MTTNSSIIVFLYWCNNADDSQTNMFSIRCVQNYKECLFGFEGACEFFSVENRIVNLKAWQYERGVFKAINFDTFAFLGSI